MEAEEAAVKAARLRQQELELTGWVALEFPVRVCID